jgi:hypothetical protein
MPSFYRFRSVEALLGDCQELEKQEIYFCSPQALNDPIEGFKDLFWQGDEIVWRNLLKHYVLCLMKTFSVAVVSGKDYHPAARSDVQLPVLCLHIRTFGEALPDACCNGAVNGSVAGRIVRSAMIAGTVPTPRHGATKRGMRAGDAFSFREALRAGPLTAR